MRKLTGVLSIVAALAFTSCSNENNELTELNPSSKLLQKFTVTKNKQGKYNLNYDVTSNVISEVNDINNNKEIYFYESPNTQETNLNEAINLQNEQVELTFVNTNNQNKKQHITIIDDEIVFEKGTEETFLADYTMTGNGNTYTLDFTVNAGVSVNFEYNESLETYEIHLAKGKSSNTSFSRTFTKEVDKALRIDFINHVSNTNARELAKPKKPRWIIVSNDAL